MKRRITELVLAGLLVLSAAGCGSSKALGSPAQQDSQQLLREEYMFEDKKVGVCIYEFSGMFVTLFRSELKSYLISLGFSEKNIMICDARNNEEAQIKQIQDFLAEDVDVLVVNPVDASDAEAITDMAVASDTPLIYINREPDKEEQRRWKDNAWDVCYVGCDSRQAGTYQGEMIAELGLDALDKNQNGRVDYIMIAGSPDTVDAQERTKYSITQLTDTAHMSVNCLYEANGDWDRERARQKTEIALNAYGDDIEVVFCNSDAMALGALEALKAHGQTVGEDIYLVGVDGLPEAVNHVMDGTLTGTVFNDYFAQSHRTGDAAVNYLTGKGNGYSIQCDYIKVTKDNAEKIMEAIS